MLKSRYNNPLEEFVVHGVKELTSYTYVLLIDMTGQTLIKRIKADKTEILFALKDDVTTIEDFWANATTQNYNYLYKV